MSQHIPPSEHDQVSVTVRWQDHDTSALAQTMPLQLDSDHGRIVVAPGRTVMVPRGHLLATAIDMHGKPVRIDLLVESGGVVEIPARAWTVADIAPLHTKSEAEDFVRPDRPLALVDLAFSVERWAPTGPPLAEQLRLQISREPGLLRISSESGWSAPLRLDMATRSTRSVEMAVPPVAPYESALIDLRAPRAWGARPAVTPSDPAARVLMAYIGAGEHAIAREMALALAHVKGQERCLNWAEPSFAQLLFGYAFAMSGDVTALRAWCRRTDSVRFLGADGVLLAAETAWRTGDDERAIALLTRASTMANPVMTMGLEIGVRLALVLASGRTRRVNFEALGPDGAALARLATDYSRRTTSGDPDAETVTTPASPSRALTLEGGRWWERSAWAVRFLVAQVRYQVRFRRARDLASVTVPAPATRDAMTSRASRRGLAAGPRRQARSEFDVREQPRSQVLGVHVNPSPEIVASTVDQLARRNFFAPLVAVVVTVWAGLLFGLIVSASLDEIAAEEAIAGPLAAVSAAVFFLLGVFVATGLLGRRTQELTEQAVRLEELSRAREEDALRGRALAATLQAEATGMTENVPGPLAAHARLSRALFGDLIGDVGVGGEHTAQH